LIDSTRTRKGLGDLIDAVNNGSLDSGSADDAINAVIDQRRQLLSDVQSVDPPFAFARSAALLKASLIAALADDLAVQDWIDAKYRGDDAAANAAWQHNISESEKATAAKTRFAQRVQHGAQAATASRAA
jgi:hypothetical protein